MEPTTQLGCALGTVGVKKPDFVLIKFFDAGRQPPSYPSTLQHRNVISCVFLAGDVAL